MERIFDIEKHEDRSYDGYKVITTEQVIIVGISNEQSCCENWGYFWSADNPDDFLGAELLGISIVDTELNTKKFNIETNGGISEGGTMFVNFETDKGILQFTAYNAHDGYYGHKAFVKSTQLNHMECV